MQSRCAHALSLLVVWDLLQGNRAQAAMDSAAIGAVEASAPSAPVLLARFAALPSAASEEWKSRAERMIPPAMTSLRQLALGYALLFDGKRQAALPVWEQIVNATPATHFFVRAIYARLRGKQPEQALLPDPRNFNPFLAVLDQL